MIKKSFYDAFILKFLVLTYLYKILKTIMVIVFKIQNCGYSNTCVKIKSYKNNMVLYKKNNLIQLETLCLIILTLKNKQELLYIPKIQHLLKFLY